MSSMIASITWLAPLFLGTLWEASGFVFLWKPLAWIHMKIWRAAGDTYAGRQLIEIRAAVLTLVFVWYGHFYFVQAVHWDQTFSRMAAQGAWHGIALPKKALASLQARVDILASGGRGIGFTKELNHPFVGVWYLVSSGPLGFLFFLFYRLWVYRKRRQNPVRGNAAPAFDERLHGRYLETAAREGVNYLGYTNQDPVYLDLEDRNQHIDCVGTTGAGKSAYVLLSLFKQDLSLGLPVVFVDAKGSRESAEAVYQMAEQAGRGKDFRLFSLTLLENSDTYNPLLMGNAVQVCDKIISSLNWSSQHPYFEGLCQTALLILLMDMEQTGVPYTVQNLLKAMEKPPSDLPDFSEFMKDKDNWKYTQALRNEFSLIAKAPFGFLFDSVHPSIDLRDIYDKNLIAYFSLDMQSYPKQAQRIGKLITCDINTLSGLIESTQKRREKKPLAVYIDEFQAFGTKNFLNTLARGRSSGLCITLAHQSIGDLKAVSPEFAQQVVDLTNTKIFLKVNDPETAQLFSDSLGTFETVQLTRQVQIGGASNPADKIMGSESTVEQYRIHPSEIKDLRPGEAVIKSRRGFGKVSLCPYYLGLGQDPIELPIQRRGETQISQQTQKEEAR